MPTTDELQRDYWMNRDWSHDELNLPFGFHHLAAGADAQFVEFQRDGLVIRAMETLEGVNPTERELERHISLHELADIDAEDDVTVVPTEHIAETLGTPTTWVVPDSDPVTVDGDVYREDGQVFASIVHVCEYHPYERDFISSLADLEAEFEAVTGTEIDLETK